MRILVTGSTGGIGSWMVKRLLEAGHALRTLDFTAQKKGSDWEHTPGDICDLALVRRLVQGMDAVVHLAAIPYDVPGRDADILQTNIQGTWNVLLACSEAGVGRVVNFSSINALGHAEPFRDDLYLPLDDDLPHRTARSYFLSKHIGEELCDAFVRRSEMVIASLRPTMVIYPGGGARSWWKWIPEERKAEFSRPDFFSYVDVRDVCEAALLALTADFSGHQAFLITADDTSMNQPTQELVDTYYGHLPWPKVSPGEYLAGAPYRSLVDCSRAKRVLGWQPKYSQRDPDADY